MITLLEIIRRSERFLAEKGIERARREAEEVIADVLGLKRLDLYLQFDRPLSESELPSLRNAIQRRSNREPTAYIAGKVTFADLNLLVTPAVLIPRPETEILVEKISQTLSRSDLTDKVLWDVCCGSGCIGLALKKRFPQLQVILSDISEQALEVARLNSEGSVLLKQGDLFEPFEGMKCDFLVCNPPYVTESEYNHLAPEVLKEPKLALVGGVDGLDFYRKIAENLKIYLYDPGMTWLEIGTGQGESVKQIFQTHGWRCHFEKDWSGNDRFFFVS